MQPNINASRFEESNSALKGTKKKTAQPPSYLTGKINQAYSTIESLAKQANVSLEEGANKILIRSRPSLEQYISQHGEVPVSTMSGIIVQAALLRASDIAVASEAMNITEPDAESEIEQAESEAVILDTAEKDNVLPYDVQAALNIVIGGLQKRMQAGTGSQNLKQTLSLIRGRIATPLNSFMGAESGPTQGAPGTPSTFDPKVIALRKKPDNAIGDTLFPSGLPTQAPTVQIAGSTDVDTSGSNFWDILDNIVSAAGSVAGAIKTVGGTAATTATQISGAVNNAGGGVVASGLSQWFAKNWLTLILTILGIALVIILIARASKNK